MLYDGYLKTVADKFDRLFSDISANYNFDNGPEFEIALCKGLRLVLPDKYGICRGFIVTSDGTKVGDDIIIFNRERFGTLRLLEQKEFGQKEEIPIETVCAYIEAKHTLCVEGNGGQSLGKAANQIHKVKALQRQPVPPSQVTPFHNMDVIQFTRPTGWPDIQNQIFIAIWSRQVRIKENGPLVEDHEQLINAMTNNWPFTNDHSPDLLVAGPKLIFVPSVGSISSHSHMDICPMFSPHFIAGRSVLRHFKTEMAFAIGVCSMIWALDNMQLGSMPWGEIFMDGLNIRPLNAITIADTAGTKGFHDGGQTFVAKAKETTDMPVASFDRLGVSGESHEAK